MSDDVLKESTVYQEAVEFRRKVELGEYSDKGYVTIPSFLGLLSYMEQQIEVTREATRLTRKCIAADNKRLEEERDLLFDAHSKEMVRADIAEQTINQLGWRLHNNGKITKHDWIEIVVENETT